MDTDIITNEELLADICGETQGYLEKSSSIASEATRTQVYEEGFQRAIQPFQDITNEECDYFGDSELTGIWFELEPDSPGARTVPYNTSPHTVPYRAEKYLVLISQIQTDELTKNINELRRYKTDVRQMIGDNMIRDIHYEEDGSYVGYVRRLVGSMVPLSSGPTRENQYVDLDASVSRESYKRAINFLTDRMLMNGVFLVNQRTATEILGWHRGEVGDDTAGQLLRKGLAALEKFEIMGVPHISTIKNDIVFKGEMFQFAPVSYLGRACRLEDIRVTIKREYDIIRMRADEQVGVTIGNPRALQLLQFNVGN